MEGCVFCKIAKGEIPSTKVYEDEGVLAFLDISPAAKGHTLVISKKHYETLLDVPHPELCELAKAVQKVAAAVAKATQADGFNVLQSNHEAAGQVVHHIHFHIIPRKKGDGLGLKWMQEKAEEEELKKYAKMIKGHL